MTNIINRLKLVGCIMLYGAWGLFGGAFVALPLAVLWVLTGWEAIYIYFDYLDIIADKIFDLEEKL